MRVSTAEKVDAFVRENIFLILQRKYRWIYEDSAIELEQELFEKFVVFAFKSEKNWLKKTAKATRPKIKHDFDNAISSWLKIHYKGAVHFTFTNDIIDQLQVEQEEQSVYDRCFCNEGCGDACINRQMCYECDEMCPSGETCRNREAQVSFDWKTSVQVLFVSDNVGAGVFSKKQLPGDTYLGYVSGIAVTLEGQNERLSTGVGDYMFKVASSKNEKTQAIDPRLFGNHTRFLNHSCSPNCRVEIWVVAGRKIAKIFTERVIEKV